MAFNPTDNQDKINKGFQDAQDFAWKIGHHDIARQFATQRGDALIDAKALDDAKMAQEVQKRKIQEKQVRALRNNYRSTAASGFLNNQAQAATGTPLGGSDTLPSKLGT